MNRSCLCSLCMARCINIFELDWVAQMITDPCQPQTLHRQISGSNHFFFFYYFGFWMYQRETQTTELLRDLTISDDLYSPLHHSYSCDGGSLKSNQLYGIIWPRPKRKPGNCITFKGKFMTASMCPKTHFFALNYG